MSDLISRKTLIKEVEESNKCNPHKGNIEKQMHSHEHRHFLCMIIKQPAIDAVPVVHCKDCKHWGCGLPMETEYAKCCGFGGYMVGKEGYCVYGELRSSAK